jgi:hypothetical protein
VPYDRRQSCLPHGHTSTQVCALWHGDVALQHSRSMSLALLLTCSQLCGVRKGKGRRDNGVPKGKGRRDKG